MFCGYGQVSDKLNSRRSGVHSLWGKVPSHYLDTLALESCPAGPRALQATSVSCQFRFTQQRGAQETLKVKLSASRKPKLRKMIPSGTEEC